MDYGSLALNVQLCDFNLLGKDDFVGELEIKISSIPIKERDREWLLLSNKAGAPVAELLLEFFLIPVSVFSFLSFFLSLCSIFGLDSQNTTEEELPLIPPPPAAVPLTPIEHDRDHNINNKKKLPALNREKTLPKINVPLGASTSPLNSAASPPPLFHLDDLTTEEKPFLPLSPSGSSFELPLTSSSPRPAADQATSTLAVPMIDSRDSRLSRNSISTLDLADSDHVELPPLPPKAVMKNISLKTVLKNDVIFITFMEYMESINASEYLHFWMNAESYRHFFLSSFGEAAKPKKVPSKESPKKKKNVGNKKE